VLAGRHQPQKGDTLIEVLFAFSVLSLIVVGSLSIMNQGSSAAQRALETTLVRQQIDAQATTLRFLHGAYVAQFQPSGRYSPATPAGQWSVMANSLTASSATQFLGAAQCPAPAVGSFILDSANARYVPGTGGQLVAAPAIAQVVYQGSPEALSASQGIWIEGIRSVAEADVNKNNTRYIDFHINACWESPGQGLPMTMGTIVRLYEPRS
jgi:type II secretory pathway pseudopilin PulG